MTSTLRHLIMLRHGETESSGLGRFAGLSESSLTVQGKQQARDWSPVFKPLNDLAAYQSPLNRARETASLAGLLTSTTLPDLREWDLGLLEGENADEYRRVNPGWSLFEDGPPSGSGEAPGRVQERAHAVLRHVVDGQEREVVVVVSHGQFIRVLACEVLGFPLQMAAKFSLGPGRASIFTVRSNSQFSMTGWNIRPNVLNGQLVKKLT